MGLNLVILAAGRGSRLESMTSEVPKCLNLYKDKTLMEHVLNTARQVKEIENILIVGGYKYEMLNRFGVTLIENSDWESTGPFFSMMAADIFMSNKDSIICYSDIVFDTNFLVECVRSKSEIFLPSNVNFIESWTNRRIEILKDLETFVKIEDEVIEIGGQPKSLEDVQGQFAGIVKVTPQGWDKLKSVGLVSGNLRLDTTGLLSLAIANGIKVKTADVRGFWKEFDNPSDFLDNRN